MQVRIAVLSRFVVDKAAEEVALVAAGCESSRDQEEGAWNAVSHFVFCVTGIKEVQKIKIKIRRKRF